MSIRLSYELTISIVGEGGELARADIEKLFAAAGYGANITYCENGMSPRDNEEVCVIAEDRRSFHAWLSDVHPEAFNAPIVLFSKANSLLLLEIEEYIRDATKMVEAGRNTYRLKNGVIPRYEIQKMFVVSTAHITREDDQLLARYVTIKPPEQPADVLVCDTVFGGYMLFVTENADHEPVGPLSPALRGLYVKAREINCQWIRLDRDGPQYDDLPKFKW